MSWRELVMEFCRNRLDDEAWWRRGKLCPYHDAFEDGLLYAVEHPTKLLADMDTENLARELERRSFWKKATVRQAGCHRLLLFGEDMDLDFEVGDQVWIVKVADDE